MTADPYPTAVHPNRPIEPRRNLRRWWGVITIGLLAAVFIEAVFAGAMLSGAAWARPAHAATALALIASTTTAGFVALAALRRIPHGRGLGLTLLGLAAALLLQAALGRAAAHGANVLWLHVPLGVVLVGLAAQAAASARRLGAD